LKITISQIEAFEELTKAFNPDSDDELQSVISEGSVEENR